jgi:ribonuclease P protein component
VVRNRAKRRLREAIRAAGLTPGFDYVVIAGEEVPEVPFATLVNWISQAAESGIDRGRV